MSIDRFPRIPPSRRGYISLLEHAHVHVADGAVVIQKDEGGMFKEYNIPYVNTSLVLLGEGTSLTRDAARLLAQQGVMIAFTGGGGTPFSCAQTPEFMPLEPMDEYRPTAYMQRLAQIFFDDKRRLGAAKWLLRERLRFTDTAWNALPEATNYGLSGDALTQERGRFRARIESSSTTQELLLAEAEHARSVFGLVARAHGIPFTRQPQSGEDRPNQFLDHANYMAYGLASVALHGLGLSFAFAMLHGKTRRGGLVFDIADLIKDGVTVPLAFACAQEGKTAGEARTETLRAFEQVGALPYLFDALKRLLDEC